MEFEIQVNRDKRENLLTTSKILFFADASWQASLVIQDVFQMIQNHPMSAKAIFISYLLDPFKKNLGPNTLYFLMEEEKKALTRVRDYFAGMDIPYSFKMITASPLETFLREVEGSYDLIILQGEFLKIWREDRVNHGPCSQAINRSKCFVLVINKSKESSLSYPDFNSKIL